MLLDTTFIFGREMTWYHLLELVSPQQLNLASVPVSSLELDVRTS
jgi:hypothetical protein